MESAARVFLICGRGGGAALPVETVRRVELERRQSQKFQSQLKGIQKGAGYWSLVFQVKRDMFGLSMMPRIKCMCLKGLLWE